MKRQRRFPACILEWQDSCHICFWIKTLLVSFLRDYCNIFIYLSPPILTEFFHWLHLFSWDTQLYSQWDTLHLRHLQWGTFHLQCANGNSLPEICYNGRKKNKNSHYKNMSSRQKYKKTGAESLLKSSIITINLRVNNDDVIHLRGQIEASVFRKWVGESFHP